MVAVTARPVDGVLISADDAGFLVVALRHLSEQEARNGRRVSPRVRDLERQLDAAASRSAQRSGGGTPDWSGTAASSISEVERIDIATAATLLDCTDRNVRAMCERGTLTAQRISGRWVVDRAAVVTRLRERTNP